MVLTPPTGCAGRAAPLVRSRRLGMASGAWEGRVRGVGGAEHGLEAGDEKGGGYGDGQLHITDVAYSKHLLRKVKHTM